MSQNKKNKIKRKLVETSVFCFSMPLFSEQLQKDLPDRQMFLRKKNRNKKQKKKTEKENIVTKVA